MLKIIMQRRGRESLHIVEGPVLGRSTILLLHQDILVRFESGEEDPVLYFAPDGTAQQILPLEFEQVSLVEG